MRLVKCIPAGRVTTFDEIASALHLSPRLVATSLSSLSEDERQCVPWHRVVARGGAIGWGPNRDQQFACLAREGVPVSPAGIVQDMGRVCIRGSIEGAGALNHGHEQSLTGPSAPPQPGRSRGMKDRPR